MTVISTSGFREEKSRTVEKGRFLLLAEFTLSNVEGLVVEMTGHEEESRILSGAQSQIPSVA